MKTWMPMITHACTVTRKSGVKSKSMHTIEFEERAVAFIDVLGFSYLVDLANDNKGHLQNLQELVNLLDSAIPLCNITVDSRVPGILIPKHLYISDSIILSAPLASSEMHNYNGLSIIVMRAIQLTHMLLRSGYLIRGAISVGKTWHTNNNIVGPAYQEAYKIESKCLTPQVKLSDSAKEYWNNTEGSGNRMCIEYRNSFMVNGLHDYYIQDKSQGAVGRAYNDYSRIIEKNINSDFTDTVRYKWWWFQEYLENERKHAFI